PLMRALYWYDAVGLGWGDLGGNVYADRFGGLWEGRYGGLSRAVQGVHPAGSGAGSGDGTAGLVVLGTGPLPAVAADAAARYAAWKLSLAGDPRDRRGYGEGVGERAGPATWAPATATWHVKDGAPVRYGRSGDIPVPADYTGDGRADLAVWRPSTGMWYVQGGRKYRLGERWHIPVPADYNGDGTVEPATH